MTSLPSGRPEPGEYHADYELYVSLVPHSNIVTSLMVQLDDTMNLLHTISANQSSFRYAPGKWSIREVLGHIIDAERVFTYRALRFARADQTPLAGFDQDEWMKYCNADSRTWGSLKEEYELVRRATIALFSSFEAQTWLRRGMAWDRSFTVRGMGFITAGHELHHVSIIRSRYLTRHSAE